MLSRLRLNEAANLQADGAVVPQFIDHEACLPTETEVLLSVTTSGGFAGRSERVALYSDGTIAHDADGESLKISYLSEADLATFMDQVYSLRLDHLTGLRYPPLPGTADSFQIAVELGSYEVIQYDDAALVRSPSVLQQFHTLWQNLPVASFPCGTKATSSL